jgi:hypothetical protein
MPNKLIIITGSGLLLSAAFLGLAVTIGGDDIFHDARALDPVKPLIDVATHKAWRWNGGDSLAMDAPINIRYQPNASAQGSAPQISLIGPAELLQHVKVGHGRITADNSITRNSGKQVEAVISGAPIRKFVINGHENLDLGEIVQEKLDLYLNGSGTVSGRGKVDHLNLTIAGPGDADLGGLEVMGDANISLLGSGDATLSPHGRVKLFIAGNADLRLLTKPAELRRTIIGNGEIHQLEGEAAKKAHQAVDASRIASDAAREAIRSALGDSSIGDIVASATQSALNNMPIPPIPPQGNRISRDPNGSSVFVRGSSDTDLGHIEQKSLQVTVANSGSVTAEGKVENLAITVLGSGDAKLGKLAARNVSVEIMGSGNVTTAPSGDLKVSIMGSGSVRLLTRPARVQRQIIGSGHVFEEH